MYSYPSYLRGPLEASLSTDETARFQSSEPASGPYFAQIISDDSPTYYNLTFVFEYQYHLAFRAWLRQDNFAIMSGAQFEMILSTEDGEVMQVCSFTPDGIPQRTKFEGNNIYYQARIIVRKLNEPTLGQEDLILGLLELGNFATLDIIVNVDMPKM